MQKSLITFGIVLLIGAPITVAQGQKKDPEPEEPPTIETILKDATRESQKVEQTAKDRFKKAIQVFRGPATDPERTFSAERRALADLGAAIVPAILEHFVVEENSGVLDQLHRVLAQVLTGAKDPETTAKLIEIARGKRTDAARFALDVLGKSKADAAAPAIRDLAKNAAVPAVRAAALQALGDMGDDQSADLWVAGLADKDKEVRRVSVTCLAGLGRMPDVKLIAAVLKDPDTDVGLAALAALGNYKKSTEALGLIHDALKINDEKVQLIALEAIRKIAAIDFSRKHLHEVASSKDTTTETKRKAAYVMLEMGDEFGVEKLAEPLKKETAKNPKDADAHMKLGRLYYDFSQWSEAISEFEKSFSSKTFETIKINEFLARCWARKKNYAKAADHLRKTGRSNDWRDLKADADFADMVADKNWAKYFGDN